MPPAVPTPVSAVIGIVPSVVGRVRRLPGKAVQLPVIVLSQALTAAETARREYDDLADRGEKLVARLRGTSFDEIEDKVEDVVARTPLAGAYDKVEDALEDTADRVREGVKSAARSARSGSAGLADDLQTELSGVGDDEAPKGAPTPKATQPDSSRVDTAATPAVRAVVEKVAGQSGGTVLDHDALPLPDYDHMTLGSLRGRLRALTLEQLVQVRDYEKAKADRLPVVTMLDNRIARLATDAAAAPTAAASTAPSPEQLVTATVAKALAKEAKESKGKKGKADKAGRSKADALPHTKVRST